MSEKQEQRNKSIALVVTIGFHGLLLLAFLLMMAWRAPNPPLPEYGIELNFGMDQQGGGEIQPETTPGEVEENEQPEEQQEETKPEEIKEEVIPEKAEEPVVSKVESPVVVKEEKKEPEKEAVKEKTPKKPKVTPKEAVKETKVTSEKEPAAKKGDPATSQGDDGKEGDKGNEEGKLDAKALYGQPGGGGGGDGFGLSMTGWAWADEPTVPNLPDNEDGRIEFEIECDENGEIIGITTLQRGLSPKSEQLLKEEIRRNSLVRTSAGKVPERSKGRVVFILKTK